MQAFGLYTHIRANRWRSNLLLAGLFLFVYIIVFAGALAFEAFNNPDAPFAFIAGQALGHMPLAGLIATALTAIWVLIAFQINTKLISWMTGAGAVTRDTDPALYDLLENLCISRGITPPRLQIIETPVPNAYASGIWAEQHTITLTRGLIDLLDKPELEAVIAHELTHLRNDDVRVMMIALVITGVVSLVGEGLYRLLIHSRPRTWSGGSGGSGSSNARGGKGGGGAIIAILLAVFLVVAAWFLSRVIKFALSRSREYLADAGAVELTKNPDAMISALLKIEGKGELPDVPSAVMELCLDNPRSGFADLFATHPTIEDRVHALEAYAGGRRPLAPPPVPAGPWGPVATQEPEA